MRKIALLGLAALALLGVTAGVGTGGHSPNRAHGVVVADTGWGDPCGGLAGGKLPVCGT